MSAPLLALLSLPFRIVCLVEALRCPVLVVRGCLYGVHLTLVCLLVFLVHRAYFLSLSLLPGELIDARPMHIIWIWAGTTLVFPHPLASSVARPFSCLWTGVQARFLLR